MNCIFTLLSTKESPDGIWALGFRLFYAGWSNKFSPSRHTVVRYEFHADNQVARHKLHQAIEEGFSLMLAVELLGILLGHFEHFQVAQRKSIVFDDGYNFSDV